MKKKFKAKAKRTKAAKRPLPANSQQLYDELKKFVTDMVHEANNPLMVISGNAQLSLLEGTLDHEIKNNLKIISEECDKLKNIFRRIHRFSKMSQWERGESDVNQCVDSAVKSIDRSLRMRPVQLKKDLQQGKTLRFPVNEG